MRPSFPYVFPFFTLLILTQCQIFFARESLFLFYAFKTLVVAVVLGVCLKKRLLKVTGRVDWVSGVLGVLIFLIWIIFGRFRSVPGDVPFDASIFTALTPQVSALFMRSFGAAVVVPFAEEIFWRGFFARYLIASDFNAVAIGTYSTWSFWVTAGAFALMHHPHEWLPAFIAGVCYGFYLLRTRNLWGCIAAHGFTNGLLSLYVILTGRWDLWG